MSGRHWYAFGVFFLAGASFLSCSRGQDTDVSAGTLSVRVSYRALWWSPEQMNNMSPNAPPPKTTVVNLDKWEYSDPIGVPHPDTVDVTVAIANPSDRTIRNAQVEIGSRWKVGPLKDKLKANWESDSFTATYRSEPMTIAPRGSDTVKVAVDLATKMKSLEAAEAWPWALETQAVVFTPESSNAAKARALLPISPAD
jgi:hypothetical protein